MDGESQGKERAGRDSRETSEEEEESVERDSKEEERQRAKREGRRRNDDRGTAKGRIWVKSRWRVCLWIGSESATVGVARYGGPWSEAGTEANTFSAPQVGGIHGMAPLAEAGVAAAPGTLALSSAQLPPYAPLSSDSASSPARQHPHHQPPAAHRPTPAAQQRL